MREWTREPLAVVADIRLSSVDKKSIPGECAVRLCNYMDVYANDYITENIDFMEATATQAEIQRFRVERGDVLITKDSETPDDIGIPAVVVEEIEDLVCGYHVALLRPRRDRVNPTFLAKQLASTESAAYFSRLANGSTRYGLSYGSIAATPIRLAPRPQQQRIAEILTTIDDAIEQTEALITKTQQIKAGLMHDLFTRGVTPDGQLRPRHDDAPQFYKESPLGWIPKEWEISTLSGVVEFLDGRRVPLKEDERARIPGPIPYFGASGIIDYIDRWLFEDELILLGEDGENLVSRSLPLAFKIAGKSWVNNHAHVLKPKASQEIDFWTEALEWRDYSNMTSGSAQPKITQGQLARMTVAVPLPSEQQQGAAILASAGSRLVADRDECTKLRDLRSGLMQDLLTGRVRVPVEESPVAAANV